MISIYSEGEGRDLVLLAGWGMHRAMWGNLPAYLAQHARVHICEMPGYAGDSSPETPNLDQLIDALADASAEKVDVLGWSLGGMFALKWAERYPQQVERLVLLAATPSFLNREGWPHGTAPAVLRNFSLALRKDAEALMSEFLAMLSSGEKQPDLSLGDMVKLYKRLPPASVSALNWGLEQLRDIDLRESIGALRCPVLLLHGESDSVTPVGASKWMVERLPHAQLQQLNHCGHAPHLSQGERVRVAIEAFLYER